MVHSYIFIDKLYTLIYTEICEINLLKIKIRENHILEHPCRANDHLSTKMRRFESKPIKEGGESMEGEGEGPWLMKSDSLGVGWSEGDGKVVERGGKR